MSMALNRKTLAEVDGLPVKKICVNCRQPFTTVDASKAACKFCRAADDDMRRRLRPPAAAPAQNPGTGRTDLWTPDMTAALEQAVAQNMTASRIADALNARFGLRLSRNAVIGKCTRLGIRVGDKSKGGGAISKPKPKPKPARPSAPKPLKPARQSVADRGGAGFVTTIGKRNARPLLPVSRPPEAPRPMPPEPAPVLRADGQPHDTLSLPYGACKWPVDGFEKPFRFCGHAAGCGEPYCEFHFRRSVPRAEKPEAAQ